MRVKLKRVLSFVSAVVICGVSCVTSWFSVPVSAIGVFSPFNFYQLYQMLHGLLLGDGGGNSQTFGEWLEKNMTRTIGSGNDKHVFLLTPGEKLGDMMSEASIRLALGAACSDGGIAGVSKMKDLIDSWTEVYDTSDIGEIGESGGSGGFSSDSLGFYPDGCGFRTNIVDFFSYIDGGGGQRYVKTNPDYSGYYTDGTGFDLYAYKSCTDLIMSFYFCSDKLVFVHNNPKYAKQTFDTLRFNANDYSSSSISLYYWSSVNLDNGKTIYYQSVPILHAGHWEKYFAANGISISQSDKTWNDYFKSIDFDHYMTVSVDDFIGPVYAMPAAKQLITDTGTLSGLRLDVQTEDGTPDISAALDHAGVESVDDLVAGVAAGTIPMSQVYEDMRVVPYVLTDVETGQVVTDLNVSATDAKTKAVALDKTLSIPKDISAADAYQVTGKTWDPEMSKYKLPLFQFFPFCLPWDIYEVLTLFDAEPVAPKFTIPVGQFFTRFSGSVDTSKAADQKAVVDLGSDSWQSTFKVIRALECAAIIIGLCLTAVLLIHGGR